jgi:lambda family phage portal protein
VVAIQGLDLDAREPPYKSASRERAGENWYARTGDPDDDTLLDLPELRRRSRDLQRNNPLAGAALSAKTANVVGTGLKLNASIDREHLGLSDDDADEWESRAEAEWQLFSASPNCDLRRTLPFVDQQELAFRAVLENGDHFISLVTLPQRRPGWPYSFALQHIEADRVCNPHNKADTETLIAGVEKDSGGAPLRYHVSNIHPGALNRHGRIQTWTPLPAFGSRTGRRLTLHLFRVLRDGQTRGVPDLAPVMSVIKQLDRYVDAEVDRAVKSALLLAFITTQDGEGIAGMQPDELAGSRAEFYHSERRRKKLELDHSSTIDLFPGDRIDFSDPKAPNAAAESFLTTFARLISSALELPHELVLRHFSSSYSAARGAMLMAWQFFQGRRAWLARELCRPVYEAVLTDAITAGRLSARGFFTDPLARQAWLGAEWIGDAAPHIDENKAVDAAVARIENGLSTLKRETASLTGQDYDRVLRQRLKERRQDPAAKLVRRPQPSAEDLDRADREAMT